MKKFLSLLMAILVLATFAIFAVGGAILTSIGIVGQYISKIFNEVKGRPHYIVAQTNKEDVVKK